MGSYIAKITNDREVAYSADSFESKEDRQNDIYLVMVADYKPQWLYLQEAINLIGRHLN